MKKHLSALLALVLLLTGCPSHPAPEVDASDFAPVTTVDAQVAADAAPHRLGSYTPLVVAFDPATGNRNIVPNFPAWVGTPSVFGRALIDNTKTGIVCLAADTNTDSPFSDSVGCTGNYSTGFGDMPSITGDYAGGGGRRANSLGHGSWSWGDSTFADGAGSVAFGKSTVGGYLKLGQGALTLTFAAADQSITRAAGDWVADEITVGMMVSVRGSVSNNVTDMLVVAVTSSKITLDVGSGIVNEGPVLVTSVAGANWYGFAGGLTTQARAWYSFAYGNLISIAAPAQYGVAFGYNTAITAGGKYGFAAGNQSQVTGLQGVAMGNSVAGPGDNCSAFGAATASGDNSHARGYLATATASGSVADGQTCHATGTHSHACGRDAVASRPGEWAHSSNGSSTAEGFHAIDLFKQAVATTINLDLADDGSNELSLDNSKIYSMRVRVIGSKVGVSKYAQEVRELFVKVTGGTATIVRSTLISDAADNFATAGWGLTISAPGGLVLRFAVNSGADTINAMARVEWSALPGF